MRRYLTYIGTALGKYRTNIGRGRGRERGGESLADAYRSAKSELNAWHTCMTRLYKISKEKSEISNTIIHNQGFTQNKIQTGCLMIFISF